MTSTTPDGRAGIDAALVRRLIAAQFPQWRDLPVTPVEVDGWDNRTYRLGDDMTVRLPTAAGYVPAVAKENEWLPRLRPQLPVAVPTVLGTGIPGEGYPFPWSVRGWLPGETSAAGRIADMAEFARSLAGFIRALQLCDTAGAPPGGEHSWFRGCSPAHYDDEAREGLATLGDHIDTALAAEVWAAALAEQWRGSPVWFHGDIASGNLLVVDGKLAAVIDFGTSGVGDPACDLVIAWTMFTEEDGSRAAFRDEVAHDAGAWARARGWALWKAMLVLGGALRAGDEPQAAGTLRVISEVLADHERAGRGSGRSGR